MIEFIKKHEEILRYVFFGALTTLVSLLTYYSLTFTILDPNVPIKLQIANIISWIVSVSFAYFTNRKYVFKVKDGIKLNEMLKFYLSRLSTLLIDASIMFIFCSMLGFSDKIIKIFAQVIVIVLNYFLSKIIVFKKVG